VVILDINIRSGDNFVLEVVILDITIHLTLFYVIKYYINNKIIIYKMKSDFKQILLFYYLYNILL